MSKLSDLRKQKEDLESQMKDSFNTICADFFQRNPNVSLVWTQYAPYFNDGDPCYFSVHEVEIQVDPDEKAPPTQDQIDKAITAKKACQDAGTSVSDDVEALSKGEWPEEEDDSEYEHGSYGYGENDQRKQLSEGVRKEAEELADFIGVEEDLMETLYGTDQQVVLSKGGADLSEYSHD